MSYESPQGLTLDDINVYSSMRNYDETSSIASSVPSASARGGESDRHVMEEVLNRSYSRVSQDPVDSSSFDLPKSLSPVKLHYDHGVDGSQSAHSKPSASPFLTPTEIGTVQDILVRYESKAYDLLAQGRHDHCLKMCNELKRLIHQVSGITNNVPSQNDEVSVILMEIYGMAVESESHFMQGNIEQARTCLLHMDKALETLSFSETSQNSVFMQQMLPRVLRCGVACYTMLGNLFFFEAKKFLARAHKESKDSLSIIDPGYRNCLQLSVEAFRHAVKLRKREGRDPGFGHTLLGRVYVAQGNFVAATSQFEEALRYADGLKLNPHEVSIFERRNLADMWLVRNNFAAALEQYITCVKGMAVSIHGLPRPSKGSASDFKLHDMFCRDYLTQASLMATVAMCLRALGQLDQAIEIVEEAEHIIHESRALSKSFCRRPMMNLNETERTIPYEKRPKSTEKGLPSPCAADERTPNRRVHWDEKSFQKTKKHGWKISESQKIDSQSGLQFSVSPGRLTVVNQTIAFGEIALQLLIKCSIEKGHAYLRADNWHDSLELYSHAEGLLNSGDPLNGINPIMKEEHVSAMRGTIEMFRGDVFAHRLAKLIRLEAHDTDATDPRDSWMDCMEEAATAPSINKEPAIDGASTICAKCMSGSELYSHAVMHYDNAFKIALVCTQKGDPYRITCLARVGQLHAMCKRWERSLPIFRKCLKQAQTYLTSMHSQLLASLCVAVADVLRHGADPQQSEALKLYFQALHLYQESIGANTIEMGAAYLGIGHIWRTRGIHDRSLKYYSSSEAIARMHLGEKSPVTLHVRTYIAYSLMMLGNNRKSAKILEGIIAYERKFDSEKKSTPVLRIESTKSIGVSSLLYRWYSCRPDEKVCAKLLAACNGIA